MGKIGGSLMEQSRKERFLSQKGIKIKTKESAEAALIRSKRPLAKLEKLLLFLLFIFIVAAPFSLLVNMNIMMCVGLANYFILGLAIAVKPDMVIEIMQKGNYRFEEIYAKRITSLTKVIRLVGVLFLIVGGFILYNFVK